MRKISLVEESRKTPSISSAKSAAEILNNALGLARTSDKSKDFTAAALAIKSLADQAKKSVY